MIRLNKVYIIRRTFAAHCGGLITIRSYKDASVKTRVDVSVFAHEPHKRSAWDKGSKSFSRYIVIFKELTRLS